MRQFLIALLTAFSIGCLGFFQNTAWNYDHIPVTLETLDSLPPVTNQTHTHTHAHQHHDEHYCGADHLCNVLYQNQPQLKQKQDSLEDLWQRLIADGHQFNASRTVYTIPVVVHVVHNNGPGNIPDASVQAAIQNLNDAFTNLGPYNPLTGVDTEIRFCLAQRDPTGASTTGITNTVSTLADLDKDTQDGALKSLIQWDPYHYVNIWVVNNIIGSVAGYAYFPSAHGSNIDGIVIEKDFMGTSSSFAAVLVHEMGHYLGLYHTFQGGCTNNDCTSDGDKVCDTPPDNTTARPACGIVMNSCSSDENDTSPNNPFRPISMGGLGDQADQKENYMDYSTLTCYDRFSAGQKDRMHFFLQGTRASLLSSLGCLSPCTIPINIAFTASAPTTTAGQTLNFSNTTTGATSYEWFVNGASFATTTNSSYLFGSVGTYWIVLQATNSDPNCTTRDSVQITVFCAPPCGEICDNGIDDDGNGLIDCYDSTCVCDDCSGKQANIWYFGNNAGMDFNGGAPVSINGGQTLSSETAASIADPNGNLLFYTDGVTFWNRNHAVMPNGSSTLGNKSTSQISIVPMPGNPYLYYVFMPDFQNSQHGLFYSIVDMSLNNNLGAVTQKDVIVSTTGTTEHLIAVKHCNNLDYWIICKEFDSNNYHAYEFTGAGIDTVPLISSVGTIHSGANSNSIGHLKASRDGKRLAISFREDRKIEIYDFDNSTGIISNPLTLYNGSWPLPHGIEFSPNNNVLYCSTIGGWDIYQFDVTPGNTAATIFASFYQVASSPKGGAIQMGPDGKIYRAQNYSIYMDIIHNPDVLGVGCTFQADGMNIGPNNSRLGTPNFVQEYLFVPPESQLSGVENICLASGSTVETYRISNYDCILSSVNWTHNGVNAITVVNDTTLQLNASVSGTDTIIAEMVGKCVSIFDTIVVQTIVNPQTDLGPDTSVCQNGIVSLYAGNNYSICTWQDGAQDPIYTATESGLYWVECTDYCGATYRDSIMITVDTVGLVSFQDTSLIAADTISLNFNPSYTYQWVPAANIDCDTCATVQFYPTMTTTYHGVAMNSLGCFSTDSFTITVDTVTSINNSSAMIINTIKVFPNPAKDFVKIQSSADPIDFVRVYDASGRLIDLKNEIFAREIELSTRDYPNGMVLIQVFGKGGMLTEKVLIDR